MDSLTHFNRDVGPLWSVPMSFQIVVDPPGVDLFSAPVKFSGLEMELNKFERDK